MADHDVTLDFQGSTGTSVLEITSSSEDDYVIRSVTPIEETWQRATTTSPDMHGAAEVSSVLAEGVLGVVIACKGTSWADLWGHRDTLVAAATASSWLLEQTVEGVVRTWTCRAANISNPGITDALNTLSLDVTLSIPVHPVPETGS
jgi:hypothetical protein